MIVQSAGPALADKPGHHRSDRVLAGPTLLDQSRTIVPLRIDRRLSVTAGESAELVIEGLAYDASPGVLYEVSLQAPDGRRALLGTVSFYNRTAPGYGANAGANPNSDGGNDASRTFDATQALRDLGGKANALVFEASSGVVGPGVRAAAHPGARVRFASARLIFP
jgi:hypothetical protein